MNRSAVLGAFALAAACGGKQPVPSVTVPGVAAPTSSEEALVHRNPALAARRAFENPGGMWIPHQMRLPQHQEQLRAMGVGMSVDRLTDPLAAPLNAVVSLGGCTGSFVSPQGLVVTNHHCVQRALQFNSSSERNLVEQGFLAREQSQELPAGPAQRISVAQAFHDVTDKVVAGLDSVKDPVARKRELDLRTKRIVAACEKDRPELRCDVVSFFGGAAYKLIEYLEIKDVRLVYAPTRSIGNYGGEVDNWAWPRHSGDWSFYRAYVAKDGKPADPSLYNVPYQPKHFLKLAHDGIAVHDFVMVVGYPGRTSRITTFAEVQHDVNFFYPYTIDHLQSRYTLLEQLLKPESGLSAEGRILAGVLKHGLQNGLAKFTGVLRGLQQGNMLERKRAIDAQVRSWAAQPDQEAYAEAIRGLDALVMEQQATARADRDRAAVLSASGHLRNALLFMRLAEERKKADEDRRPGYQQRDMPRLEAMQKQFARQFDPQIDRALFRLALVRALALPAAQRPWLATIVGTRTGGTIDEAAIDRALERLYGNTKLADEASRLELLKAATPAKLRATKDAFIQLALALWPTVLRDERRDDAWAGQEILLTARYAEAMQKALDGFVAPDANATLRITYGTVRPLEPKGSAFTVASEILAKDTGRDPFDAPAAVLEAIRQGRFGPYAAPELGGLPVNFIADLDITGGNSGSPVLDANGKLVGLAFDGNIEGVASDVVFNHATTRTIGVDKRYMLWVMDLIDGADNLLREMGVKPAL